jgi:hypothetical protein
MSATNAPFGLRPAYHPSGLDRAQALANGITSGYSTQILKGQPVAYSASAGVIIPLTTNPASGSAVAWSGAFAGFEWTDTTGRRRVSNYYPASTSYVTGSAIAYFYNDQNIIYEIQADGAMAQTTIGNEYNFTAVTSGSTTTGLSTCTLGSATAAGNNTQGQMRVVDLAPYVDNAWGDSYTVVRVVNAQSQFFGSVTAIA